MFSLSGLGRADPGPRKRAECKGVHCSKPSGDHRILKVYKRDVEKYLIQFLASVKCERTSGRNLRRGGKQVSVGKVSTGQRSANQQRRAHFILGGATRDRAATASATLLDRRNGFSLGRLCLDPVSAFPVVPTSSVSQSGWTHKTRNISCSVGLSGISGKAVLSSVDVDGCSAASARLTEGGMASNGSATSPASIGASHTSSFADLPWSSRGISNGFPTPGKEREALKGGPN